MGFLSHAKISVCSHFKKTAAFAAYKIKTKQHTEQSLTGTLQQNLSKVCMTLPFQIVETED